MFRLGLSIAMIGFLLYVNIFEKRNKRLHNIAFLSFVALWFVLLLDCTFGLVHANFYDYTLGGWGLLAAACSAGMWTLWDKILNTATHRVRNILLLIPITAIGFVTLVTAEGFRMPSGIGLLLMFFIGIPLAANKQ